LPKSCRTTPEADADTVAYTTSRGLAAASFILDAVLHERLGSVSKLFFDLPGLRVLPRRIPRLARFFDLEVDPEPVRPARRTRRRPPG
jgi:hypothetical protein